MELLCSVTSRTGDLEQQTFPSRSSGGCKVKVPGSQMVPPRCAHMVEGVRELSGPLVRTQPFSFISPLPLEGCCSAAHLPSMVGLVALVPTLLLQLYL